MNLRDIFRTKKQLTVDLLLDQDKVKQMVMDFVEHEMPTARAVIIIWGTAEGDIRVCLGGGIQNECTAVGVLDYAKDIIKEEGIPI